MKETTLKSWHESHGAKLIEFGGWLMPVQYAGIIEEYWAVRKASGLFDICHMGEITVVGNRAEEFLQSVVTNNVGAMGVGRCLYSPLCYPDGGIVDDLIIYKQAPDRFLLVVNASNTEKDFQWLARYQENFKVQVKNISAATAFISLQGPEARKLLQKSADIDLSQIDYFSFQAARLGEIPVVISRTGYTGEMGYEIFYFGEKGDQSPALKLWQGLITLGAAPCGLGARDLLRLEMKYPLYGNDIDQTTNPLAAGLGWAVDLNKKDFIGKKVLEQVKTQGLKRKLAGLTMAGRQVPRHNFLIFARDGREIGKVTSGSFSPALNAGIALGYVDIAEAAVGNGIQVEIRGNKFPGQIVKTPFVPSHVRD